MSDKSSSRTEKRADGLIEAFVTENGEEHSIGAFADERHAQFEVENALEAIEARKETEPAESEAKPAPKATGKKDS